MNYTEYFQVVRSASELPDEVFATHWMLMPCIASVPGTNEEDLDMTKEALKALHKRLNRSLPEIRALAGLSQAGLAHRFGIPVATVQNWEARDCCPIYVRLMMMELFDQWNPETDMGVSVSVGRK